MRVLTPLPPSRSGIAHYAATLFGADAFPEARFVVADPAQVSERAALEASAAPGAEPNEDTSLLQLGNNPHHAFVFEAAMRGGGVLDLHDFSVHHLLTDLTLARGDEAAYVAYLEEAYGAAGRRVGLNRLRGRFHPRLEFLLPANGPLVRRSRAVIVHSAWAAAKLRTAHPGKRITRIPHFCLAPEEDPLDPERIRATKRAMGHDPNTVLVLAAGFVTPPKQVPATIRAVEAAAAAGARVELVIAGEMQDPATRAAIKASPIRSRIRVTGYLTDARLDQYMLASDIVPVLRFPSAGESSGIVCRALGLGKVVVVPAYMGFTEWPSDTCTRLPLGENVPARLGEVVRAYAEMPAAFAAQRAAARAYALGEGSLGAVRDLYRRALTNERTKNE